MASEITYAEVKFKNAPPAAAVEVPPETKKHEHHPQKYPPWLPWLISLLLLLVCIALVIAFFAIPLVQASFLRPMDQGYTNRTPSAPQHPRGPDDSCSVMGQILLTNHRLATATRNSLVAPSFHSSDQPTALQQNFTEWECITTVTPGKERSLRCCPKGWKRFQEKCYYLSADEMSWVESVQNCTGMGSHLVVINSEAEQRFLTKELRQFPQATNFYIGLTAQEVGKWQWVDQTPLNEKAAFWREGEPSNVAAEKCVVIHTGREIPNWNDARCESHRRICEVAAPSFSDRPSS